MADTTAWIAAVRSSHDRLTALLTPLSPKQLRAQSYDDDWSIAQVASHLGSQAEIFALGLHAGLSASEPPEATAFQQIWARWDALDPEEQAAQSIAANERLVAQVESLSAEERDRFALTMFGTELDLAGLLRMRLSEHAVHSWDIAVALDATATVAPDAVDLLIGTLADVAARGKPVAGFAPIRVSTSKPDRVFRLRLDPAVELTAGDGPDADLSMPAEAFLRLVFGRLDPAHTPDSVLDPGGRLRELRTAFPGF
jgi:uncharacterized protein (TIGR03083 family)